MTKLILLLGGARAGKSAFAVRLADQYGKGTEVSFIATAQALDDEMTHRIERHRAERSPDWITIEEPYQLDDALMKAQNSGVVIVDCLTLLVSNWMMREESEASCQQKLEDLTGRFLSLVKTQSNTVICVSNEVGLGIVPATNMGRSFRDLLGRMNQQFAEAATEVYLLVAGIPMRIKPTGHQV